MQHRDDIRFGRVCTGILTTVLVVSACVPTRWEHPAAPDSAARSETGNPRDYEVFGKRYVVMQSSYGFSEQGIASWYGSKFHGNPTSSGEIYDMYSMTAAHKTLPLPTTVKVTNLKNGRTVVVRVNDRGPFVPKRIIDLSYSAAQKLDMLRSGTTPVEIVAVTGSNAGYPVSVPAETPASDAAVAANGIEQPATDRAAPTLAVAYLQVGAFGESINAQLLKSRLQSDGLIDIFIHYEPGVAPALYRVRIGPIGTVDEYQQLVNRVEALNVMGGHLVVEASPAVSQSLSNRAPAKLPDG